MNRRAENLARAETQTARPRFDVEGLRADFPILNQEVHGKPLVYLDNAATSQKPRRVINTIAPLLRDGQRQRAPRRPHARERATFAYERARGKVKMFLNAPDMHEIIFTRGTTESVNLVAQSYGRSTLERRRRDARHGDGASFEYRAVAAPLPRRPAPSSSSRR